MNNSTRIVFSMVYLIVTTGMLIPTIMTLLPHEASKPNHFGYRSFCTFAPWSTLSLIGITLLLVAIVYTIQALFMAR